MILTVSPSLLRNTPLRKETAEFPKSVVSECERTRECEGEVNDRAKPVVNYQPEREEISRQKHPQGD